MTAAPQTAPQISVNGERRALAQPLPLPRLLEELQVQVHTGVAVLLNGAVVRRADWERTTIQADDALEIVRATVGG